MTVIPPPVWCKTSKKKSHVLYQSLDFSVQHAIFVQRIKDEVPCACAVLRVNLFPNFISHQDQRSPASHPQIFPATLYTFNLTS